MCQGGCGPELIIRGRKTVDFDWEGPVQEICQCRISEAWCSSEMIAAGTRAEGIPESSLLKTQKANNTCHIGQARLLCTVSEVS